MRSVATLAVLSLALIGGCNKQPRGSASGRVLNCTLEIAGENRIQNPTEADIREAVLAMDTKRGGAFLVIVVSKMTYLQASGDQRMGFEMEYQEADIQHHYRAKRRFTSDEAVKALTSYTTGADKWKTTAKWEHIKW
jgi:hypothetical protein